MKSIPVIFLIVLVIGIFIIGMDRGWWIDKQIGNDTPGQAEDDTPGQAEDDTPGQAKDDIPPGFLSEKESIDWLKTNGYQVVKLIDGYTLKKTSPDVNINSTYRDTGISIDSLQKGVTLMHKNGKIHIKVGD